MWGILCLIMKTLFGFEIILGVMHEISFEIFVYCINRSFHYVSNLQNISDQRLMLEEK